MQATENDSADKKMEVDKPCDIKKATPSPPNIEAKSEASFPNQPSPGGNAPGPSYSAMGNQHQMQGPQGPQQMPPHPNMAQGLPGQQPIPSQQQQTGPLQQLPPHPPQMPGIYKKSFTTFC